MLAHLQSLASAAVLALVAVTALAAPSAAQDASLAPQLEAVRAKYSLPALAAAVVKEGQILATGAVGTRLLGTEFRVAVDDRFHLGSDTKAMTATLAAMLVEEGKLAWTSTIGEVLGPDMPGLNEKFAAIRLEQLLSHTSGIPTDDEEMLRLYTNRDDYEATLAEDRRRLIAAWGRKHEPKVPDRSPFQYANLGYVIVGAMLEKVSGAAWEHLITTRIFEPLGLKTAGLGPQATFGRYDATIGHRVDDEDGKVTPIPWGPAADAPAVVGPAGIAHMSIADFATWAGWNAGGGRRGPALVRPETLQRLHRLHVKTPVIEKPKPGTPKTGEYALGWGIAKMDWTPRPILTHNGSNSLNLAMILVDLEHDLGIVVMTNFPGEKADEAALETTRALYGQYGPGAPEAAR